jgi:hypothetical protein
MPEYTGIPKTTYHSIEYHLWKKILVRVKNIIDLFVDKINNWVDV